MSYLNRDDKLLVIIGPSGVGKSSTIRRLTDEGLLKVTPSWTTRPPRTDEARGAIEHHFVSDQEFKDKDATGYFLEPVQLFGLPYWYGLPKVEKSTDGAVPTIMLRANLIAPLKNHYTNYTIYQIEDELQKTKDRLLSRQASGQELGTRLADYQKEITLGRKLADRIFTNDKSLELLADDIKKALLADGLLGPTN